MTLVALFAMTAGAWAEGTVYSSSVDVHDLQPDDILIEGASITGIASNYCPKIVGYYLQGQEDGYYTKYNSSRTLGGSDAQVTLLAGGVIEYLRTASWYTYTPCDSEYNPLNAWIVTQIEDLGSETYRVQITAYQYGSAEVEANVNPGEKTNLLDKLNQAKNSGLTLNVGSGDNAYTLNFDKDAVNSILEGNPSEVNIETSFEEGAQNIGTTSVLAKLIVNLTNGSQALNFNAGKVIASLKLLSLNGVPTGKELQTWYFDNVNNLPTELIPTVYDAINKMATITMSHFSTYGLLLYTPAGTATLSDDMKSAEFEMPGNDVTVDYELVRDMEYAVSVEMLTDRIQIKNDGEKFVPVDEFQLVPTVKDVIDSETPVILEPNKDYTIAIQKKDGDEWVNAETFSVGMFRIVITGMGLYDGVCYSSELQLFEGYEVQIAAGEYATFFTDENLTVEDEYAQLYTITAINDTKAVLSSKLDVVPANIPVLIFNSSDEAKTFLLKPTDQSPASFMYYANFVGTLTATTVVASDDATINYIFNGTQFESVTTATEVGANQAWLALPTSVTTAQTITLISEDEATKITATDLKNYTNGEFYDLNGRKLNGKPTEKGVYIQNGKKIVIR